MIDILYLTSLYSHLIPIIFSCKNFTSLSKFLDVPASLAAHGQEGAFSASGANGSIISCNTEKEELNHKISKEFFEELSCSKAAKNNNFHGKKEFLMQQHLK